MNRSYALALPPGALMSAAVRSGAHASVGSGCCGILVCRLTRALTVALRPGCSAKWLQLEFLGART